MTILNTPDVMPPIAEQDFLLDMEVSVPVLAWDGSQWFVAFCRRDTDTGEINWYTDCSETWTVTDSIKGWIPLPTNPTI
jgi:hypothetical protein